MISIHAPLTGCDTFTFASFKFSLNFNPRTPYGMRHDVLHKQERIINISIHAPLTGCDSINFSVLLHGMIFQSTHPLRDATFYKEMNINEIKYFNPRTPYGMRQSTSFYQSQVLIISIHAPLTGCDFNKNGSNGQYGDFNPRTPYGMRL